MPRYMVEPGTGRIIREAPVLTQQEFMDRWEASPAAPVLDFLFALEGKDSAQGAMARKWLTRFRTARGIDPKDERTEANTDNALSLGVAVNLITQAQAIEARAILLAPVPEPPQWIEE